MSRRRKKRKLRIFKNNKPFINDKSSTIFIICKITEGKCNETHLIKIKIINLSSHSYFKY